MHYSTSTGEGNLTFETSLVATFDIALRVMSMALENLSLVSDREVMSMASEIASFGIRLKSDADGTQSC